MVYGWVGGNPLRASVPPGEVVRWEGKPDRRSFVLRGSWLLIPLSIVVLGPALLVAAMVSLDEAPLFVVLLLIPNVAFGLVLSVGRFWAASRVAARTFYLVTDRRVMIQTGAFRTRYTEIPLTDLPDPQLTEQPSGIGTIAFGKQARSEAWSEWFSARPGTPAFVCIPGVREVLHLIEEAR